MPDLSGFLTSGARFFVKCNFTKNVAFLKRVKKSVRTFLHAEGLLPVKNRQQALSAA